MPFGTIPFGKIYYGGKLKVEVNWTEEQSLAIKERASNILVAAAARQWKNGSIGRKNYRYGNK